MRYRRLDDQRDYVLGRGGADLLRDVPEAVAQAVATRLRLLAGEWFLDLQDGTPYAQAVLGKHTRESYDLAIRGRILGTEGVREIVAYESALDPDSRRLSVTVTIDTVYGPATVSVGPDDRRGGTVESGRVDFTDTLTIAGAWVAIGGQAIVMR